VTLIEPALILCFGALVGFIALAMLQAIYGIDLKMNN
jgi:type II secretory pathway component PulF